MLAVEMTELTREEIIDQIRVKSERAGRDAETVIRNYLAGDLVGFGLLAEVYALCELLDSDDELRQLYPCPALATKPTI